MAARKTQQHVTGGRLWGNERVRLGISLNELAARSGVPKSNLSMMEHGRLIPTSEEYDRVVAALNAVKVEAPGQ